MDTLHNELGIDPPHCRPHQNSRCSRDNETLTSQNCRFICRFMSGDCCPAYKKNVIPNQFSDCPKCSASAACGPRPQAGAAAAEAPCWADRSAPPTEGGHDADRRCAYLPLRPATVDRIQWGQPPNKEGTLSRSRSRIQTTPQPRTPG
jgi:hypothetical protein